MATATPGYGCQTASRRYQQVNALRCVRHLISSAGFRQRAWRPNILWKCALITLQQPGPSQREGAHANRHLSCVAIRALPGFAFVAANRAVVYRVVNLIGLYFIFMIKSLTRCHTRRCHGVITKPFTKQRSCQLLFCIFFPRGAASQQHKPVHHTR